jgi:hypothetical protein
VWPARLADRPLDFPQSLGSNGSEAVARQFAKPNARFERGRSYRANEQRRESEYNPFGALVHIGQPFSKKGSFLSPSIPHSDAAAERPTRSKTATHIKQTFAHDLPKKPDGLLQQILTTAKPAFEESVSNQ